MSISEVDFVRNGCFLEGESSAVSLFGGECVARVDRYTICGSSVVSGLGVYIARGRIIACLISGINDALMPSRENRIVSVALCTLNLPRGFRASCIIRDYI